MPTRRSHSISQSMQFKTWKYYVIFAACILAFLAIVQVILFEPLYRQHKINTIQEVVESIGASYDDSDTVKQITMQNEGCAIIVSPENTQQGVDAIGVSCLLYQDGKINSDYVKELKESENGILRYIANVNDTTQMLIYGKTFVDPDERPYYVIFNTPIQPLQSTIDMIRQQFIYFCAMAMILSLFMSLFFSNKLSKPIADMTQEAKKLSTGNTDVHFEQSSFAEFNELADTLNFAAQEIQQVNQLRTDLIANVSHDIKTPLTMITAYAEMIRDISGNNEEKRNKHLEVIMQESAYLNRLVEDMRDLSVLQAGTQRIEMTNFDLGATVNEAVYKFRTITKQEGVEIQVDIEPELVAIGDQYKILEVLYNFIGNAIKHYGDDKLIIVSAHPVNRDKIRVEVTDHGHGMDAATQRHIWERYYKNDKNYKRAQSGSGLGLSIAKAILDLHNAQYGVVSELGKGSTFYFELSRYILK